MKKNLISIAILSYLMVFTSQSTFACICGGISKPLNKSQFQNKVTRQYNRAAYVFSGEILSLGKLYVVFKINQIWKGEATSKLDISTGTRPVSKNNLIFSSSSCDYRFDDKAGKYLVFAYRTKHRDLQTMVCSLTNTIRRSKRTIKVLNKLKKIENIK